MSSGSALWMSDSALLEGLQLGLRLLLLLAVANNAPIAAKLLRTVQSWR